LGTIELLGMIEPLWVTELTTCFDAVGAAQ
jgi:hypothetical protein